MTVRVDCGAARCRLRTLIVLVTAALVALMTACTPGGAPGVGGGAPASAPGTAAPGWSSTVPAAAATSNPARFPTSRSSAPSRAPGRPLRSSAVARLSGNELRYGAGYAPSSQVIYQPAVVLIGGGADAVRAVSASGMTWTIDANAPGASELAVGKIMLATSFGTGRVLKLDSGRGAVQVVIGPVTITDIIRDVDLGSAAPIPLGDAVGYATPTAPGAAVDDPATLAGEPAGPVAAPTTPAGAVRSSAAEQSAGPALSGSDEPHPLRRSLSALSGADAPRPPGSPEVSTKTVGPVLPAPTAQGATVGAGDFQVTPFCCTDGAGMRIGYDKGDGRLQAELRLKLQKPTMMFRLTIRNGKLSEATAQVHGAASVEIAADAATLSGAGNFNGQAIHVPETLTIPLAGLGVPLVISVNQDFKVSMQLIGASSFHAKGGYRVSGDLGFGYSNGAANMFGTTLAVADPMTANTRVLGVASGRITVGWSLKLSVGVGVVGFSAGVWYQLGIGISVVADGLSLTAGAFRTRCWSPDGSASDGASRSSSPRSSTSSSAP